MIKETEFKKTTKALGLTSGAAKALAQEVWMKCEAAMLGNNVEIAAVLKSSIKAKKQEDEDVNFTRQELQFIKTVLQGAIVQSDIIRRNLKEAIEELWTLSDPNAENTEAYFAALNDHRSFQRKFKRNLQKLVNFQRKVKKQLSQ